MGDHRTVIQTPPSEEASSACEGVTMKIGFFSGELPHDDIDDLFRLLHNRSKSRRHPLLAAFLEAGLIGLREEIEVLPQYLKELLPPFETILDLSRHGPELRRGLLCGAIERVLLCILKLGLFILYFESRPQEYHWSAANSCLLGMGVGMLMCGAVSLSPRLTDLPIAGAETLKLAFRFGVFVGDFSRSLETVVLGEDPKKYVCAIFDVDEETVQKELDAAQNDETTPETSRIMICNVRNKTISVDGPPVKIKALFSENEFFCRSKHAFMTAYGGICHAGKVYTADHVPAIVNNLKLNRIPDSPVISLATGKPYHASSAKELFAQIVHDVLIEVVRWESNLIGAAEYGRSIGASTCQIYEFRPSHPMADMKSTIENLIPDLDASIEDIVAWVRDTTFECDDPRTPLQAKLAIVGMSCRFPGGADDVEKFWDLLNEGLDVHRTVPADRFNVETHFDPEGKKMNASHTPFGCFINEPGLFDAAFFNMSPREAEQTDPMHRLALVTAYEALEMAGHVTGQSIDPRRIGTFYGQASDDYREVNSGQEVGTYFIPGGCRAFAPGRINYFFKFSGPSFSCDTACSSSLATIQMACTSLWAGDTDMVIAGGLNVITNCDVYAGLSHGHFLSKTGGCKTWDSQADGYCRADGVGSIVIKRLADAEANNDNILGVILSAATNHSAEAISITHPHAGTQSYLYNQVTSRAGIDPLSVGYVEMHGTGTQAGDATETKSITDVFAPTARHRRADQPLYVGAVKANVGHGEAAAGVMAFVKTLLVLQKEMIPPYIGIKNSLSPSFPKELQKRNLHIPFDATPWQRQSRRKRIAIVNNFGAAGGNTTIALEEAPLRTKVGADPRSTHVITISAKGNSALKANINRLLEYVDSHPQTSLAELSYTLCARRLHHTHRVAVAVSETSKIRKLLSPFLSSDVSIRSVPTASPAVAFTFTGQGSFYIGIGKDLYQDFPVFQKQILHLDYLVKRQGFDSILPAIEGSIIDLQGVSPVVTQLTIVCVEIALTRLWEHLGIKPSIVIGHSLGEYAALCAAGVLSASDAIFLVGQRARALEQTCESGAFVMMAVRGTPAEIAQAAGGLPYEIACVNGPRDLVVVGTRIQMELLAEQLQGQGRKTHKLDIPHAFHSEQMDPILSFVERVCSGLTFRKPQVPIISPLLGKVVQESGFINGDYVVGATRQAVNFVSGLQAALDEGIIDEKTVWIEIGPHPICLAFLRSTLPAVDVAVPSLKRGEDNWSTISQSLASLHCAGVRLNWRELYRPFEGALSLLNLPAYAWNNKTYWIQYRGDWSLTKGSLPAAMETQPTPQSSLRTSSCHRVVEETFAGTTGKVVVESNVIHPDIIKAVEGHKMNNNGVVSSFVHADTAYTLADYIFRKLNPKADKVDMNMADFEYHEPVVSQRTSKEPQLWRISAEGDVATGTVSVKWYNPRKDLWYAHATVHFGEPTSWLSEWAPLAHLVSSRIDMLRQMAEAGDANKLSRRLAYKLFANLVDYSEAYWGMQSVILDKFEAAAEVTLPADYEGKWIYPPYFLDALTSLSGFILNVSDAVDNKNNFFITPAWKSMRFAKPLIPGGKYQSYVKMIPTGDAGVYAGDVYVLQEGAIIGVVGQIQFRQWPRILLDRFFSPPDAKTTAKAPLTAEMPTTPPLTPPAPQGRKDGEKNPIHAARATPSAPGETSPDQKTEENAAVVKALNIVSEETALDVADLTDDALFVNLGIDSLMSLVIAQRFRQELQVEVRDSLFIEFSSIGGLKNWLAESF
ncbi:ketoacyl-synt-domain-containing protein [Rhizodiscina lignyota]|uniref:Ketoacyl-synt-domain-containing protein n=1 Tax=Rhizodiscina lignyota TaxID=1504668 RepID=A0A9P4IQ33_9PEZI|nr:ketoacyl-synt-domain-containing protein [Rhizodiscina lignyota]